MYKNENKTIFAKNVKQKHRKIGGMFQSDYKKPNNDRVYVLYVTVILQVV